MSDAALRAKRLRIRCWRRGTKEMDLLLGGFLDARAETLDEEDLGRLEALIEEEDQTLYRWIAGGEPAPDAHRPIVETIRAHHLALRPEEG